MNNLFQLFPIESKLKWESIPFLSPLGKCHYWRNFEEINLKNKLLIWRIREIVVNLYGMNIFSFVKKKFILNQFNQRPELNSFTFGLNEKGIIDIEMKRTEIRKLEFPYETNCRYYENNTSFDCNNDCYRKQYMEKLECYPNYESLFTIELLAFNESELTNFCFYQDDLYIRNLNQEIIRKCNEKCLSSCLENKFEINYFQKYKVYDRSLLYFSLGDESYLSIKYSPKISLMALIISIVNIWSLWHGFYIMKYIENLINYCKHKFFRYSFSNLNPISIDSMNVSQMIKMMVKKVFNNLKIKVSFHSITSIQL